jgi:competence ComEA-like helix-hairpin-helix protein
LRLRGCSYATALLPGLLIAAVFISCAGHEKGAKTDTAAPVSDRPGEGRGADIAPGNPCVNLNTATAEELSQLPGIGEVMSRKIIEYRERHGPFRRPEEIIIIEGFSERKYRALAGRVCV